MSVLDLRTTVNFFSRPMIRHIAQPGAFINGLWVKASPAYIEEPFRGDFQPLTGRDIKMMPEGERADNKAKLYSTTRLYAAGERTDTESDLVGYEGKLFKVITLYNRFQNSLTFKYILELLPDSVYNT